MNPLTPIRKGIYITVGTLCLLLGFIGIVVPVLPTTPFWLATAYLYIRSSAKLYERIMQIPIVGRTIRNFQEYRAISRRVKIISTSTLWATILISIVCVSRWWVTLILLCVAAGVTWHILSYPTLRKE